MSAKRGPFTPANMSDEDVAREFERDLAALVEVLRSKFGLSREEAEAAIEARSL